ncbi:hypothetical protein L7F22_023676 [Adiantum nelumboides]|nr:hypothetical protein [Adiantum nelumboides]
MASGEGQSNPSTFGDAGGDHNKDYGNKYGPPLPTQEELREMEHSRLVGEAMNMMLNFAKDANLAKYMVLASKSPQALVCWMHSRVGCNRVVKLFPKFDMTMFMLEGNHNLTPETRRQKQYFEKELEEEIEARLAQIFDAHKKGKKHGKKRRKSTDFPGYLDRLSTFDKAKKHKKRVRFAEVPSSSSSSDSSLDSSEEDRKGKKRSKKRHRKGKKKARKSKYRRVDDSSTEDTSRLQIVQTLKMGTFMRTRRTSTKLTNTTFWKTKARKEKARKSTTFPRGEKEIDIEAAVLMNALCKPWELGGHPHDFYVAHRSARITDATQYYEHDTANIKRHERMVAEKVIWSRQRAIRDEMLQLLTRLHSIERQRRHFNGWTYLNEH